MGAKIDGQKPIPLSPQKSTFWLFSCCSKTEKDLKISDKKIEKIFEKTLADVENRNQHRSKAPSESFNWDNNSPNRFSINEERKLESKYLSSEEEESK